MNTAPISDTIKQIKDALTEHIVSLKDLLADYSLFKSLSEQYPGDDYSETMQLLENSIENERYAINKIRRGII